jgi:hypothetical protein
MDVSESNKRFEEGVGGKHVLSIIRYIIQSQISHSSPHLKQFHQKKIKLFLKSAKKKKNTFDRFLILGGKSEGKMQNRSKKKEKKKGRGKEKRLGQDTQTKVFFLKKKKKS